MSAPADRYYQLESFIEVDKLPDDENLYWYLVFLNDTFFDIVAYQPTQYPTMFKEEEIKIFCLPRSGWNDVIHFNGHIPCINGTVGMTLQEVDPTSLSYSAQELISNRQPTDKPLLEGHYFVLPSTSFAITANEILDKVNRDNKLEWKKDANSLYIAKSTTFPSIGLQDTLKDHYYIVTGCIGCLFTREEAQRYLESFLQSSS